ncbi:MAG: hypothetical protein ABI725_09135 [Chloroflexota bacterium]
MTEPDALKERSASFIDPTATMFLLVLIVSTAALIYLNPGSAPQPPVGDDSPDR